MSGTTPHFVGGLFDRAEQYAGRGQHALAAATLEYALALLDGDVEARPLQGHRSDVRVAIVDEWLRAGEARHAIERSAQYLAVDDHALLRLAAARAQYVAGNLREALRQYDAVPLARLDEGAARVALAEREQVREAYDTERGVAALAESAGDSPMRNRERGNHDRADRRDVVGAAPQRLIIETSSICNLRCVMCPQAYDEVHRPRHLPVEVSQKLASFIGRARWMTLHGIGEPLLSDSLWQLAHPDVPHETNVDFNTNGVLLTPRRIERVLASRIDSMSVSLDAATPLTYRRIRGADLDQVVGNLKALRAAREAAGSTTPKLRLNMTLMRENIGETELMIDLAAEVGAVLVELWPLNDWPASQQQRYVYERDGWAFRYADQKLETDPVGTNRALARALLRAAELGVETHVRCDTAFAPERSPLGGAEWDEEVPEHAADIRLALERGRNFAMVGGRVLVRNEVNVLIPASELRGATDATSEPPEATGLTDCALPWNTMQVLATGDVQPCCYVSRPVGNLNEQTVEEIWNGPAMRQLRRDLAAQRVNGFCKDAACPYMKAHRAKSGTKPSTELLPLLDA